MPVRRVASVLSFLALSQLLLACNQHHEVPDAWKEIAPPKGLARDAIVGGGLATGDKTYDGYGQVPAAYIEVKNDLFLEDSYRFVFRRHERANSIKMPTGASCEWTPAARKFCTGLPHKCLFRG